MTSALKTLARSPEEPIPPPVPILPQRLRFPLRYQSTPRGSIARSKSVRIVHHGPDRQQGIAR
jgi:hypothetical protein